MSESTRYFPIYGSLRDHQQHGLANSKLDLLSFRATPIELLSNDGEDTVLFHATGFFWRRGNRLFLVSNYHVLTGRDGFTDELDQLTHYIPRKIRVYLGLKVIVDIENNTQAIIRSQKDVNLFDSHGNSKIYVHPNMRTTRVDVAAVEVEYDPIIPPNSELLVLGDVEFEENVHFVGSDVFITGYPFSRFVDPYPSIWKRGSFATDPSLAFDGKPCFLVDAITSKGMSGSPVYRRVWGPKPSLDLTTVHGGHIMSTELIGIYSGRVMPSQAEFASFGIAWHKRCVEELILSIPGT